MKTRYYLLIMLFLTRAAGAQNLVLNGDFGLFYSCPTVLSMIDSAQFWVNATTNGTPDYFHQCSNPFFAGVPVNQLGYQLPHSGEEYAGLYLWQGSNNYREFMQGQLTTPLTAGTCYHFEMFISLSNFMKYTASNIGAYFSQTSITGVIGSQLQIFTPQVANIAGAYPDTANWMLVSGNFTAAGGESYIIIGNFDLDSALDSMIVNPTTLWPGTHVYVDDVSLTECTGVNDPGLRKSSFVFPNPVQNLLHVETDSQEASEIIIFNCAQQVVMRQRFISNTTLDLNHLRSGIYFYKILSEKEVFITGKVNKM